MKISTDITAHNWTHINLENDHGMHVGVLDYGGIITHINVPDKSGELTNVVLGYENLADYSDNPHFFGAIVGRVAGRITNGTFDLQNRTCHLEKNEGNNHLHGGPEGFHQVIWDHEPFQTDTSIGVKLTHSSPNGAGGYPGRVTVTVTYTLKNDNSLLLAYEAHADQLTPLALTNHTYFNLSGALQDTIQDHMVELPGEQFTELNDDLLPTGNLLTVTGTPFDFRSKRRLGDGLIPENAPSSTAPRVHSQNAVVGGGYDHYLLFDERDEHQITMQAASGNHRMTIDTDQPGVVLYTANGLDRGRALNGGTSRKHLGVCFETQAHPAALHHQGFPPIMVEPGKPYKHYTRFMFDFG